MIDKESYLSQVVCIKSMTKYGRTYCVGEKYDCLVYKDPLQIGVLFNSIVVMYLPLDKYEFTNHFLSVSEYRDKKISEILN